MSEKLQVGIGLDVESSVIDEKKRTGEFNRSDLDREALGLGGMEYSIADESLSRKEKLQVVIDLLREEDNEFRNNVLMIVLEMWEDEVGGMTFLSNENQQALEQVMLWLDQVKSVRARAIITRVLIENALFVIDTFSARRILSFLADRYREMYEQVLEEKKKSEG